MLCPQVRSQNSQERQDKIQDVMTAAIEHGDVSIAVAFAQYADDWHTGHGAAAGDIDSPLARMATPAHLSHKLRVMLKHFFNKYDIGQDGCIDMRCVQQVDGIQLLCIVAVPVCV